MFKNAETLAYTSVYTQVFFYFVFTEI